MRIIPSCFFFAVLSLSALFFLTSGPAVAEPIFARAFAPWMDQEAAPVSPPAKTVRPGQALNKTGLKGSYNKGSYNKDLSEPGRPDSDLATTDRGAPGQAAPSRIEQAYSKRVVDELAQFGYDLFRERDNQAEAIIREKKPGTAPALPAGAVQDDFLLSIGDELQVTFRGQRQDQKSYQINSQGQLIIDDLPPVTAAGRTIGQVREVLTAHAEQLINTQIYVALESVRQAQVTVIGHVARPGRQNLTVFHNVLDALMAAGGISKQGSLRQVKLVRNGRGTYIDLYALLIHGSAAIDINLRDGDRLIIPPIGPTVAVTGSVNRPGIYEILPARRGFRHDLTATGQAVSLEEMLTFAGGVLNPGQNRFLALGLTSDGREMVEPVTEDRAARFGNGTILVVAPSDGMRTGTVELTGHTRQPGIHSLSRTKSLSALLPDRKVFGPDIYPLIGLIERYDSDQLATRFIPFPPLLVTQDRYDLPLEDGDVIHLFSRSQILALQDSDHPAPPVMPISYGSADAGPETGRLTDPVLTATLAEHAAFIRGAVRQEGAYPVAEGVSLDNLLAVAGGLTLEASVSDLEVTARTPGRQEQSSLPARPLRRNINLTTTPPAGVVIGPGDTVRVKQKFKKISDNSVLIIGEITHPGRYDLAPGDTMADLLERAGGLTAQAYPDGAIFSRESERKAEEARFRAQARALEVKLAGALEQKDEPDATQIMAVQELITQLEQAEAVGRITVEADPAMLALKPELDILLQAGDRVFIPKRPLTVRVAGEVLSPASLQFRKEKDPRDYIMEAGGFTYHADKDRAFVIYPDGSAQPLLVNRWNHSATFIPPGATVVVPRDPKPFDFIETAKDVSQILSNLAITGIFLDDIHND